MPSRRDRRQGYNAAAGCQQSVVEVLRACSERFFVRSTRRTPGIPGVFRGFGDAELPEKIRSRRGIGFHHGLPGPLPVILDPESSFGHYRTVGVIGRGAVGTVYEAHDEATRRKVALKVMYRDLAREMELRARFLREAEAVRALSHGNIVRVVDAGQVGDQPFIALEYVEGTDMEHLIQNGAPLSLEWKIDLLRQLCEGLSHAHEHGIVHRDVKPANVRITADGVLKVMDFGLARVNTSDLTKRGRMIGSAHYVAPEQIEGEHVDHRADVFSVGAVAYELLSLRKPFEADSVAAVMTKILTEPPDPEALPHSDYSPGLEQSVLQALHRDPARRQQSLQQVRGQLLAAAREAARRRSTGVTG